MGRKYEEKLLVEADGAKFVVRRRERRKNLGHGVSTDAQVLQVTKNGKRCVPPREVKWTVRKLKKRERVDFHMKVEPLSDAKLYFHRLVAYAWRGTTYEIKGGGKRLLPEPFTWDDFSAQIRNGKKVYEVDHGPSEWREINIDALRIVTPDRNRELYQKGYKSQ